MHATSMTDVTALGALRQLQRAYSGVARCLERHVAPLGLTPSQAAALGSIAQADGTLTISGLAAELGQETQGMTGLLDRPEKQELVRRVRDLSDRRLIRLELTEAGRAELTDAAPAEAACAE